jgi:glyoxylase-like metal-dependent hydrolase (beta-lactamase superfamily II)
VIAPYRTLEELEPGICRLLANNPSPFTFTGTQSYVLGEREVAVIDPGPNLEEHVDALIEAIAGRPVVAILCTHSHRDHSPAARPLANRTGAPVVGCAPLSLQTAGPRADASFDIDYTTDRILHDGESIVVDGTSLTAVATAGHTSNHLCFAYNGALFTGDHVMGWSTTVIFPPDGDMADYMASLEKLRRRDDRIYYPAHGPAVEEPQRYLDWLVRHRREREQQIVNAVANGDYNVRNIVAAAYPGLDPRLTVAASGSVVAHLLDLERRGLVVRSGEEWTLA